MTKHDRIGETMKKMIVTVNKLKNFTDVIIDFKPALNKQNPDNEDLILINMFNTLSKYKINDWIIVGFEGELYPCKPHIFEQTYKKIGKIKEKVKEDGKTNKPN